MGFCMGVRRAIKLTEKYLGDPESLRPIGTLGPLIHNQRVIESLKKAGVKIYDPEERPRRGTVVIRAHGIPRAQEEALKSAEEAEQLHIVNGTCPKVIRNQRKVQEWSDEGRHVVILGDADHGEIISLASYAASCTIALTPEDLLDLDLPGSCGVIAQTTLKEDEWEAGVAAVREHCPRAELFKSICLATRERQEALEDLCRRVDAVVVVGGKNSANTRRLFEKVQEAGLPGWYISGAAELPSEVAQYDRVGLTAGASTAEWIIDEVEKGLYSLGQSLDKE